MRAISFNYRALSVIFSSAEIGVVLNQAQSVSPPMNLHDLKSLNIPELVRSKWAILAVCAVFAAGVALLPAWWYYVRPVSFPENVETLDVVVPAGAGVRTVAQIARTSGLGVSEDTMVAAMRLSGDGARIHAGRYRFPCGVTMADVVRKFSFGEVESFSFRIPDGMTIWQLRRAMESVPDIVMTTKGKTDEELRQQLGIAEKHLEGLFAPETYKFKSGVTDVVVFRTAYQRQKDVLDKLWASRDLQAISTKIKTPYDALILASIVEKETSHPEDRLLVSSVFHNRLRVWMPLQTDPAVIYGLGEEFDGNLRRKNLTEKGPYNTYVNYGLPPSPIAMPSEASIYAALHPAKTKYLYFVARGDGTTHFSRALSQHNHAVNRYQRAPKRRVQNEQPTQ